MVNEDDVATQSTAIADDHSRLARIAQAIAALPNGKRAQLRRIYLTGRHEAEGIVMGLLYRASVFIKADTDTFGPWKLFAHCVALLSGTGDKGIQAHSRTKSLGVAFHATGISEDRLLRLTSAQGSVLHSLVIQTMRRMSQKHREPVNLFTLFDLIGPDDERSEAARLRIAKDFYAAKARSEGESSSDD